MKADFKSNSLQQFSKVRKMQFWMVLKTYPERLLATDRSLITG